jgi:hypothetical protein
MGPLWHGDIAGHLPSPLGVTAGGIDAMSSDHRA